MERSPKYTKKLRLDCCKRILNDNASPSSLQKELCINA